MMLTERKESDLICLSFRKVDKGLAERAENAASSAEGKKSIIGEFDRRYVCKPPPGDLGMPSFLHGFDFMAFWFGPEGGDPFPLDEIKLIRVSSLFKAGGYKSFN